MDSFVVVSNKAAINYTDTGSTEEKKIISNYVSTIIYNPRLLLTSHCTKKYRIKSNYCYINSFCIYNYSLNLLHNVYIRIYLPNHLKYIHNSLTSSDGCIKDINNLVIFIKEIHPMQKIYISFCSYKPCKAVCLNNELAILSIKYYIISNSKKNFFSKGIILRK